MKENPCIRNYQNHDKEAVLNLLKLNTPQYFSPEEEKGLIYFLENEIEYYFVIEFENMIVGSGGFNFSGDPTKGFLSWDILHPEFQGKSLGSMLVKYRISRLREFKDLQKIRVRTSQLAYKFYKKMGFTLIDTVADFWAKGFHLYDMEFIE